MRVTCGFTFILTTRYSPVLAPGKNPRQCVIEAAKDANSFFTRGFAKCHEHSCQPKCDLAVYEDGPARIGREYRGLGKPAHVSIPTWTFATWVKSIN
jgi:hypothetical protein